jgi:hypothetical protein
LPNPLSALDPPERPDWRSALSTAQFGPIAEDLLGVSLAAAGSGSATIARPIVDRGVDLYLRRLRSLLTIPIQVKAFQSLTPDGNGRFDLPVKEVIDDPNAYLAVLHVPAPHDQLYRRLFMIPFSVFRERCPRVNFQDRECLSFAGNFSGLGSGLWGDCLLDVDRLPEWLASIPGWTTPIPPVPHPPRLRPVSQGDALTTWRGDIGRLWTATELERAGGGSIVIAQDRIRLDTVTFLIHDLASHCMAGLHIRTGKLTPDRRIHFEVSRPPFFIDEKLYVLLVLLQSDDRLHDFCLLIPSVAMPGIGYSSTITLDPLTKHFAPYRVPSDDVGSAFLKCAFAKS